MKPTLFAAFFILFECNIVNGQYHYIPSTSTSNDTLSYLFYGGSFRSEGCLSMDPTYWINGYGDSAIITFVMPQSYPSIRVWGMNYFDTALVRVNTEFYFLDSTSATYDSFTVCGISYGPDGIKFANGKIVGPANNNFTYQNVQLKKTNVSSISIIGLSGAGWGFAGISVCCPYSNEDSIPNLGPQPIRICPNPFQQLTTIQFNSTMSNAEIFIYNLIGDLVRTITNISGNKIEIKRDNLGNGMYLMHMKQNGKTFAIDKLIIHDLY